MRISQEWKDAQAIYKYLIENYRGVEVHSSQVIRDLGLTQSRFTQAKRLMCRDSRNYSHAMPEPRRGYVMVRALRLAPDPLLAIPTEDWQEMILTVKSCHCDLCNRKMHGGERIWKAIFMQDNIYNPGRKYDAKPRIGTCCAHLVGVEL